MLNRVRLTNVRVLWIQSLSGFTLLEVLIYISLSSMLLISVFQCTVTIESLHQKQHELAALQNSRNTFMLFLRERIQAAGSNSCAPQTSDTATPLSRYTSQEAQTRLHIFPKPNTDVLKLYTCVLFQERWRYLPVYFFVAPTTRFDHHRHTINAFFIKIDQHPQEEFVTDLSDFQVDLKKFSQTTLVIIRYTLLNHQETLYATSRQSL